MADIAFNKPRKAGVVPPAIQAAWQYLRWNPVLWLGVAALAIPTMYNVGRTGWSTEQGAHGPIVFAVGIWLLLRAVPSARAVARPGPLLVPLVLLVASLVVYALARITSLIEIEGFAMYGALLAVLYGCAGGDAMRRMWFPLMYLLFLFPLPQSLIDAVTQPLKLAISSTAVSLLGALDYPIAYSGVVIYIGQYEVLVAAACAGLNSLISLTAIGLFYVYIRHNRNWRFAVILMLAVLPVAIVANFIRVLILVLITYYLGESAAQGFLHDFAGITMFFIAVLAFMVLDFVMTPLRRRLARQEPRAI